jgi:16S rRNA (uracil1498-N3)-methyltransferase
MFYFHPENLRGSAVGFTPEESRHMAASLRLKPGQIVSATDGAGSVYKVRIGEVRPGRVAGEILERIDTEAPATAIWVFQGVIKHPRMDLLVEKCVELGVAGLVVVRCERSVEAASSRLERWRRIAVEAMKQSMQARLPAVTGPLAFDEALTIAIRQGALLVASGEPADPLLRKALGEHPPASVALWVGPEGGFTQREASLLVAAGAVPFRLGRARLRSETAALASAAAIRGLLD